MSDVNILAVVGSLRRGSVNGAVARAAIANAPDGVSFESFDLRDLPFYDGDVEEAGLPPSVISLNEATAAADGLLIFTPEYNSSYPAVTKNAIDWLTRPPRAWTDKAVSMVVATPGPRAGMSIRTHFESTMTFQPIRIYESLGIGSYGEKLDADGSLSDPAALVEVVAHVAGFAEFCRLRPEDAEAT